MFRYAEEEAQNAETLRCAQGDSVGALRIEIREKARVAMKWRRKRSASNMKLIFASSRGPVPEKLILVFADEDAAAHFRGDSWMAQALKAKGIETHVVKLPNDVRERIVKAQSRQYR